MRSSEAGWLRRTCVLRHWRFELYGAHGDAGQNPYKHAAVAVVPHEGHRNPELKAEQAVQSFRGSVEHPGEPPAIYKDSEGNTLADKPGSCERDKS
jgi:hypothetical protein